MEIQLLKCKYEDHIYKTTLWWCSYSNAHRNTTPALPLTQNLQHVSCLFTWCDVVL